MARIHAGVEPAIDAIRRARACQHPQDQKFFASRPARLFSKKKRFLS